MYFLTFLADDDGATAIEYSLLAALIGLFIVSGAAIIGQSLSTTFNSVATHLGTN